jgi:selenocysteine-specific elongation factor
VLIARYEASHFQGDKLPDVRQGNRVPQHIIRLPLVPKYQAAMSHVIIGTAGHIDHGKTALVKALTGVDTDRLKEEKARGLTIDLGFAHLADSATIIDVPGHEKFIRNMVAGVSTIDLVLLVVAADDGVMPQTREHLDILKILQVERGMVIVTKCDLVDEDWLALVTEDIGNLVDGSFLADAPIFRVSSVTEAGIPELKSELLATLSQIQGKKDRGVFWLPVDRVFTMRGFGTVLTGSVLSGSVRVGATLALMPQQNSYKVRGLQTHGRPVDLVATGDRAAVNLQGMDKQQASRGDVLTAVGYAMPTRRVDTRLRLLASAPRPLKSRTRIRLHLGTAEIMARVSVLGAAAVAPGEEQFVQLSLEQPVVTRRLDRFVIRQYSPTLTIGGGVILDAMAKRHRASDSKVCEKLSRRAQEDPLEVVEQALADARFVLKSAEQLASEVGVSRSVVEESVTQLDKLDRLYWLHKPKKTVFVHRSNYDKLCRLVTDTLEAFHVSNPSKLGLGKAELQAQMSRPLDGVLLDSLIKDLVANNTVSDRNGTIRTKRHEATFESLQQDLRDEIATLFREEGFATSSGAQLTDKFSLRPAEMQDLLGIMMTLGQIVRVEGDIYFHPDRVAQAQNKLVDFLEKNREITVSQFRELLGVSRKFALPLLSYFDGIGVTRRQGDVRVRGSK